METRGRLVSVDLLRGFALLGILLMNMSSFALPTGSYYNPTSYRPTAANLLVHGAVHLLADQKMMALFSLLFGASLVLLMERTEAAGRKFGRVHYARMGWLLLFGLLHFVLLWDGDILTLYALCGALVFLARRWRPWLNLALGLAVFLAPAAWAPALHADLRELDVAAAAAVEEWWAPPAEEIEADIAVARGPWTGQVAERLGEFGDAPVEEEGGQGPLKLMALEAFCRALGMMLAGMALFRWGLLSAARGRRFYVLMAVAGLVPGLALAAWGLGRYHACDYHFIWSLSLGRTPNLLATPLLAGGYLALVMLWSRSSRLPGLRRRLAAAGRLAFSHYIGQTLLAAALFHGWGLGLYARLGRPALLGVTAAIWILQLAVSPWWLARFRMGPLEWLWRSLTYWRPQPLRR